MIFGTKTKTEYVPKFLEFFFAKGGTFKHYITLHVPKFNFLLERIALVSSNNLIIQFVILIFFPLQKLKDKSVEQIEEKHGLSVIGFVDINFIWHIL